jgi:hypothetical protein
MRCGKQGRERIMELITKYIILLIIIMILVGTVMILMIPR